MESNLIFAIGIIVLLVIIIWVLLRTIKKNNIMKENIDENILKIFYEVERGWEEKKKNGDTTTNPYKYLWEVTARDRFRGSNEQVSRREPETSSRELYPKPITGQHIQNGNTPSPNLNKEIVGQPKRNSNINFFSRFKRTSSN